MHRRRTCTHHQKKATGRQIGAVATSNYGDQVARIVFANIHFGLYFGSQYGPLAPEWCKFWAVLLCSVHPPETAQYRSRLYAPNTSSTASTSPAQRRKVLPMCPVRSVTYLSGRSNSRFDFAGFSGEIVKLDSKFDSCRSLFGFVHCRQCKPFLICRLRVSLDLAESCMAGNRRNLVHGASSFRETTRRGFT